MLTPLIIMNNSPNTWGRMPLPKEAIAILFDWLWHRRSAQEASLPAAMD
jgi:hypothetical protein